MRKKDLENHKNRTIPDLTKELGLNRERLNSLKWDLVQGKVKNIKEMKQVKKTIAQILTILRQTKK